MLQRIYGTAWETAEELEEYLWKLEEAKKRDHRKLGRELDLFSVNEEVGPGLILWHPKGGMVRKIAEDFCRQEHERGGYELVYSPHIGKATLWETSGHLGFYRENMYSPMDIEGQEYYPQADELPLPHPDLQEPDALLPRPAAALRRVGHGLPLRAQRRAARPAARARLHPGRCPHLLPAGPDAGGDRPRARLQPEHPARLRLPRLPGLPLDPQPGEVRPATPEQWAGADRGACGRLLERARVAYRGRRGRGRVLRPEDRHQDARTPSAASGSSRRSSSTSTCRSAST